MTVLGWMLMSLSLALVWGLTLWCYYRVLTLPPADKEIPAPVKDFHSA